MSVIDFSELSKSIDELSLAVNDAAKAEWSTSDSLLIVSIAASVLLAICILAIQLWNERQRRKTDLVISLFSEWDRRETLECRIIASGYLERQPYSQMTYDELSQTIAPASLSDWSSISRVIHFAESLGDLLERDCLDMPLARVLFKRDMEFWLPKLIMLFPDAKSSRRKAIAYAEQIAR